MQFNMEHSSTAVEWFEKSNYLCMLAVANEKELYSLICKAKELNIKISIFKEPDIDNEVTAIALAPGIESKELCKNIKLALKDI